MSTPEVRSSSEQDKSSGAATKGSGGARRKKKGLPDVAPGLPEKPKTIKKELLFPTENVSITPEEPAASSTPVAEVEESPTTKADLSNFEAKSPPVDNANAQVKFKETPMALGKEKKKDVVEDNKSISSISSSSSNSSNSNSSNSSCSSSAGKSSSGGSCSSGVSRCQNNNSGFMWVLQMVWKWVNKYTGSSFFLLFLLYALRTRKQ